MSSYGILPGLSSRLRLVLRPRTHLIHRKMIDHKDAVSPSHRAQKDHQQKIVRAPESSQTRPGHQKKRISALSIKPCPADPSNPCLDLYGESSVLFTASSHCVHWSTAVLFQCGDWGGHHLQERMIVDDSVHDGWFEAWTNPHLFGFRM